jgi:hypothetical protein
VFHVTAATISSWMKRVDEEGLNALVQTRVVGTRSHPTATVRSESMQALPSWNGSSLEWRTNTLEGSGYLTKESVSKSLPASSQTSSRFTARNACRSISVLRICRSAVSYSKTTSLRQRRHMGASTALRASIEIMTLQLVQRL